MTYKALFLLHFCKANWFLPHSALEYIGAYYTLAVRLPPSFVREYGFDFFERLLHIGEGIDAGPANYVLSFAR